MLQLILFLPVGGTDQHVYTCGSEVLPLLLLFLPVGDAGLTRTAKISGSVSLQLDDTVAGLFFSVFESVALCVFVLLKPKTLRTDTFL